MYTSADVNTSEKVREMTNYREILRLRYLGINHSQIATRMGISRQTVVRAVQGAAFFFKQWGTWGSDGVKRSKKANGKALDGKIIQMMPQLAMR